MLFSIIIPTCNRIDMLEKCLDCLRPGNQLVDEALYEIIVTDDSRELSASKLINSNYKWAHWVQGPGKGPAANRNYGARFAKGDWLIFIDDDCLADKQLLAAYLRGIKRYPGCKAFEGSIYPDNWDRVHDDMAECPINIKGGVFWSANVMIDRKLFEDLGGFDEQFKIAANEDQDLYERILPETAVWFLEDAKVVHPVRYVSFRRRVLDIPRYTKNWHYYYRKNHSLPTTITKALRSQFAAMKSCVKYRRYKKFIYHFISMVIVTPILLQKELSS